MRSAIFRVRQERVGTVIPFSILSTFYFPTFRSIPLPTFHWVLINEQSKVGENLFRELNAYLRQYAMSYTYISIHMYVDVLDNYALEFWENVDHPQARWRAIFSAQR